MRQGSRRIFALARPSSSKPDQTLFSGPYTPHGHATRDQSRLGIIFAKEPPKERVTHFGLGDQRNIQDSAR